MTPWSWSQFSRRIKAHLGPWIPEHIAKWEPVSRLVERLTGFDAEFRSDQKWRFAMFTRSEGQLLGELGLFPRSPVGRTPFVDADRRRAPRAARRLYGDGARQGAEGAAAESGDESALSTKQRLMFSLAG